MKNIKAIKNRKGVMFYTLAGIMVIALVAIVALHILRTTYTPKTADSLHVQKLGDAIYSLQSEIGVLVRQAQYPAVWKAGHNVSADGVNYYLTLSNGKEKLREDITKDLSAELDRILSERALLSNEDYYVIESSGINITVSRIDSSEVTVKESMEGLTATIPLHMRAKYRDIRYEDHFNLTSETPVRIFDMYDRAKAFHENYKNVEYYATALLYIRGYANAYSPQIGCNPYLTEGHISYDPLDTFLKGDITALDNTKLPEDLTDVGAIPVASWLYEWSTLGEPNFLPPGLDMPSEKKQEYEQGYKTITENEEYTKKINDLRDLKAQIADMKKEISEHEKSVNNWLSKSDEYYEKRDCCTFKEKTQPTLTEITEWIGSGAKESGYIIDTGSNNGVNIEDANGDIDSWDTLKTNLEFYISHLVDICEVTCSGTGDCDCPDSEEGCDSPECDKISCDKGDSFYSCIPEDYTSRSEEVDCTDEEGEEYTDTVDIDVCKCKCRPDAAFIDDIRDDLVATNDKLASMTNSLNELEKELNNTLAADEKLSDFRGKADTISDMGASGFDVVSHINYNSVKYKESVPENWCNYYQPEKTVKDDGVCADWSESFGLYSAQVTAAATASYLTGGALSSAIKYAVDFFPAVYDYEANYTVSETLVDDKNRIMLHNIFAGDDDLYGLNVTPKLFTHVAPEFVIYQNKTMIVKSSSLGRLFLYLYLPELGITKVQASIAGSKCKGYKTDGTQCIYATVCA